MKVVFRVDANTEIGTGHLMRCLALASALRQRGVVVQMISRENKIGATMSIPHGDISLMQLPAHPTGVTWDKLWENDAQDTINALGSDKVDWLVVDHYGLDARWETRVRKKVGRILVIDDLANRPHDCDLLVDQNPGAEYLERYKRWVSPSCRIFLGPQYAFLREEFRPYASQNRLRTGRADRFLISMGGADLENVTKKAIQATRLAAPDAKVQVIVGYSNPHQADLKVLCAQDSSYHYVQGTSEMARLMKDADMAIGAGGITTWERCFMGLPAIVVTLADNQERSVRAAAEGGAIVDAGWFHTLTVENLAKQISVLRSDSDKRRVMSERAIAMVPQDHHWAMDVLADHLQHWETYAVA